MWGAIIAGVVAITTAIVTAVSTESTEDGRNKTAKLIAQEQQRTARLHSYNTTQVEKMQILADSNNVVGGVVAAGVLAAVLVAYNK